MSKQLVLSVKSYDFKNNDGERVVGAKITYTNRKPSTRDNEVGFPPLIVSVSNMDLVKQIREVPAVYDMDFEQVTGKNNKPEIILTDVALVAPVNFGSFFEGVKK